MRNFHRILSVLLVFTAVSGCIKTIEDQGYATNFSEIANIDTAILTKEQVTAKLGSPSTVSSFGDETWYYIKAKTERVAFLKPEAISREVLAITFDKEGAIKDVEHYTLKDGRKIAFAKDTTPTEGNELTLGKQLLGNLGRFNPTGTKVPGQ